MTVLIRVQSLAAGTRPPTRAEIETSRADGNEQGTSSDNDQGNKAHAPRFSLCSPVYTIVKYCREKENEHGECTATELTCHTRWRSTNHRRRFIGRTQYLQRVVHRSVPIVSISFRRGVVTRWHAQLTVMTRRDESMDRSSTDGRIECTVRYRTESCVHIDTRSISVSTDV